MYTPTRAALIVLVCIAGPVIRQAFDLDRYLVGIVVGNLCGFILWNGGRR